MIHVSMGRRSRSPFSPLSLRMMSRADLMSEPSCWAVVSGAADCFVLAMEFNLRFQITNIRSQISAFRGFFARVANTVQFLEKRVLILLRRGASAGVVVQVPLAGDVAVLGLFNPA